MNRTKDLRRVINTDMKSCGKVVEVVGGSGYDCNVIFVPGGKEYRMSRLSLDRLSDDDYDRSISLFTDVDQQTKNDEVSDAESLGFID